MIAAKVEKRQGDRNPLVYVAIVAWQRMDHHHSDDSTGKFKPGDSEALVGGYDKDYAHPLHAKEYEQDPWL